jgi:hypothetical protein
MPSPPARWSCAAARSTRSSNASPPPRPWGSSRTAASPAPSFRPATRRTSCCLPAIALAAPPATRREPRPTSDSAARRSWRGATATIPWRSGLALALQALDEHSDAEQLVEDELTLARVFVADRAVGIALRARGLLMRGDAAIAGLREAVQVVAATPRA